MASKSISYDYDGTTMIGHLAIPDTPDAPDTPGFAGLRPAVLVCHEGPGLDEVGKAKADRLASLGYIAFALDYHGGGKRLPDMAAVMARLGPLMGDPDTTRALGRAGLDVLRAEPGVDASRVAAIGYCFGGTMSLELARGGADLKAVVGFHSGLATTRPGDASNITAKVLVCIGTEDPLIPAEQRAAFEAEMRAGNVDWRMNLYGGAAHSFTNPNAGQVGIPGIAYHQQTDERSWRAMLDLFAEVGM
jgi:dienelactone hydrolase